MRFFTKEVLEDWDEYDQSREMLFKEACELNYSEYLKAKERLPKKFTRVFEETGRFDDDPVPYISIITEYGNFTHGVKGGPPSVMKMIIVDYDNHELAWEIIISNIKEIIAKWKVKYPPVRISCISHHELIIEDEKHISWEMLFSDGLDLKVVFKNISIRKLEKEEIENYRQPVKVNKREKSKAMESM